jgi:hypothetical protein
MQRRLVTSLLVCLALALALFVPLRAQAAILPACENREVVTLAPPVAPSILFLDVQDAQDEPAPEPACASPASHEPEADSKVAAMCDQRGLSIVAPPRIHPVSDDRIEASPSCEIELLIPHIGPSPRDGSSIHLGTAFVEPATIADITLLPPPAFSELAPAYPPVEGEARAGVVRDVYHPPR